MAAKAQMAGGSQRARTPLWSVVRKLEKDTDSFRGKLAQAVSMVENVATENLRRAPYTTLAAAAAAGFVLGGGVTPRILLAAFWLGGRTAVAGVAKELLVERLLPQQAGREGNSRDRESQSPRRDS
jgi:ElaB/YqjD/DUF883 family membrane-anchored ribosome-binding protein